ncbi:hypothetical protein HHI36_011962, partial [Cryptolaemus montrouzieri]
MVPALIIHCINEIELRDQRGVEVYRVPGSEEDVNTLKEKFLRRKAALCRNDTGEVKDFLRYPSTPINEDTS